VSGAVVAKNGDLWLNQASGVVHIAADEVSHARKDLHYQMHGELLNYLDGLTSFPEQLRPLPTAVESSDGRIYFATRGSVVWVDPANIVRNTLPPPVWIRSTTVDGKLYNGLETMIIPANPQNVEISYTAPSLLVPQRVRFRYKLEGFDKEWQLAGARRQAFYSKLAPGTYTFRVMAGNNDGLWNEAGVSFGFTVPPSFTQSVLFKTLCAVAVLGLLWLLYTIRLRQLTGQVRARLYERLAERTRIARELHDTLLQSFQGLLLHFQRARNLLPERSAEAIQMLESALDGAEQAIVEGPDAIHDLRSPAPDAKGLVEEITSLGEALVAKNGNKDAAQFRVVIEGTAQTLNLNVHIEIFRIAREALRNAFKHSQARRIETEVAYSSNLFRLRVRDDGKGMDPDVTNRGERIGHWGLEGMRERAERLGGELELWSEPGAGTELELADEHDMQFVAEASNGCEAIEQFRKHRPDIALMDLEMPGVNGIDAMIAIRNEFPDARIIILTTYAGDVRISRALKAGARGYLLKSLLRKELLDTIRAVHAGQKKIPVDLATQVADHVADDTLTVREIEVLRAIAAGNANKLIADQLSITEETVKGHVKNILSKLGANDRTHAVTIGLKRGIIEL